MKYILIGRHTGDSTIGGCEIAEQRNILWETAGCDAQWASLQDEAKASGMGILLQNAPGVLVGAMIRVGFQVKTGIVVSIPGERKADVVKSFDFTNSAMAERAAQVAKFSNGRARTSVSGWELTVMVDPVSEFAFSHFEWLNEGEPTTTPTPTETAPVTVETTTEAPAETVELFPLPEGGESITVTVVTGKSVKVHDPKWVVGGLQTDDGGIIPLADIVSATTRVKTVEGGFNPFGYDDDGSEDAEFEDSVIFQLSEEARLASAKAWVEAARQRILANIATDEGRDDLNSAGGAGYKADLGAAFEKLVGDVPSDVYNRLRTYQSVLTKPAKASVDVNVYKGGVFVLDVKARNFEGRQSIALFGLRFDREGTLMSLTS